MIEITIQKSTIKKSIFIMGIVLIIILSWAYLYNYSKSILINASDNEPNTQEPIINNKYESPPLNLESSIKDDFSSNSNYHWGEMPITYGFAGKNSKCREAQMNPFRMGFSELSRLTNDSVTFKEVELVELPKITINCVDVLPITYEDGYVNEVLGLASWRSEGIVITSANITITKSASLNGWYPVTQIHEILHIFGYNHNDKPFSIMNPTINVREFYDWYGDDIRNKSVDTIIIGELTNNYGKR